MHRHSEMQAKLGRRQDSVEGRTHERARATDAEDPDSFEEVVATY
jgi:hypothetical protein